MTVIRLDAATVAQLQAATGRIVLADETGKPLYVCVPPAAPTSEPELSPEEWRRRMDPTGGMTTAQVLEYLKGLGRP